ncbi:hypothetical protein [Nocardia carnea]|uniref:hypothetical protein n=1 Tax=Nocardia carnea TaxID=37328 RepID=UPI0024548207|nr:hypothetical protein [Nocardia carnea]
MLYANLLTGLSAPADGSVLAAGGELLARSRGGGGGDGGDIHWGWVITFIVLVIVAIAVIAWWKARQLQQSAAPRPPMPQDVHPQAPPGGFAQQAGSSQPYGAPPAPYGVPTGQPGGVPQQPGGVLPQQYDSVPQQYGGVPPQPYPQNPQYGGYGTPPGR